MFHEHYENMLVFMSAVYDKYKIIVKAAEILGVSASAFHSQLKLLNIPRKPKGHRGQSKGLIAIKAIGIQETREMTALEIAKATKFHRNYVLVLLNRHHIPFLKGVRRNSGLYGRVKPDKDRPVRGSHFCFKTTPKLPF
jgi:hypothetical protein